MFENQCLSFERLTNPRETFIKSSMISERKIRLIEKMLEKSDGCPLAERVDRLLLDLRECEAAYRAAAERRNEANRRADMFLESLGLSDEMKAVGSAERSKAAAVPVEEDKTTGGNQNASLPPTYAEAIMICLKAEPDGWLSYDALVDSLKAGPFGEQIARTKKGFYSGLHKLATTGAIVRENSRAYLPWAHARRADGSNERDGGKGAAYRAKEIGPAAATADPVREDRAIHPNGVRYAPYSSRPAAQQAHPAASPREKE